MSPVIPGLSGRVTKAILASDLLSVRAGVTNLAEFFAADRVAGTTDDTSAWQAAIDSVAETCFAGSSRLFVGGVTRFDPTALDWSDFRDSNHRRITIIVDGQLKLIHPGLVLGPHCHLIGVGGASAAAQFQIGPSCLVTHEGTETDPCIRIEGDGDLYMKGVYVHLPYGPGIQVGFLEEDAYQSALCVLENVGALARDVSTSCALRVENTFWIWCEHFAFNSQAGSGPSVFIADSYFPGVGVNTTGLLRFTNGVVAGNGIHFGRGSGVNQPGWPFTFEHIHHESCLEAFIVIDSADVTIRCVRLNQINAADAVSGEMALIDNTAGGAIYDVFVEDRDFGIGEARPVIGRQPIHRMRLDGFYSVFYEDTAYRDLELLPTFAECRLGGIIEEIDGFAGLDGRLSNIPDGALVFPSTQDLTTWTKQGSPTVTDGVSWLYGEPAFEIEFPTADTAGIYSASNGASVTDHWILAGVWLRAGNPASYITGSGSPILHINMAGATDGYWDGDASLTNAVWEVHDGRAGYHQQGAGWLLFRGLRRWNAASGPTSLRIELYSDRAVTFLAFRPFVLALPGSLRSREARGILSKIANVDVSA